MKERIRHGYDGVYSDHVTKYEALAGEFQRKAALAQLEDLDLRGKEIIDIGCGTGIISLLALEMGAKRAVCGDISEYMLKLAEEKLRETRFDADNVRFVQLDAESLPFNDNSFDAVITGMSFGLFPNQKKSIDEMFRVLKPGGLISLGAHGPKHYWEAIDATVRALNKRYVLGYRFEFWPRSEKQISFLMKNAGFRDINTKRFIWRNQFLTPEDASDFFSSVTSNWWYAKIPQDKRQRQNQRTIEIFIKRGVRQVTDDVIIGYGKKPD